MTELGRAFQRNLLLVSLILFLPILFVPFLPFLDYPNHLVRYSWLANHSTHPDFRQFFDTNWRLMPNIGFDLLGVAACKVMPPLLAGRVLLFAVLVTGGYGFGRLIAKLGGHPFIALLAPAFLISTPLFLGFNNYILGIAFVPYMLLAKMRSERGYFALFVFLTSLSFISHGEAAVLGLVLCVAWQAQQGGLFSRATLTTFFAPAILMILLIKLGPSSSELATIKWGDLKSKGMLLYNGLKTNWRLADLLWFTALVVAGWSLLSSKSAKFSSARLGMGLILLIIAVLIPEGFKVAAGLDFRIAPLIAIFLGLAFQAGEGPFRWSLFLSALIFGRSALFYVQLVRGNETGRAVHQAVGAMPKDALLFNVMWDAGSRHKMDRWNPPPLNLVHYGCVDEFRFVSGLYSFRTQQPLVYLDQVSNLNWIGLNEGEPQSAFVENIRVIRRLVEQYPQFRTRPVYVFLSNTKGSGPIVPDGIVRTVKEESFQIFQLR